MGKKRRARHQDTLAKVLGACRTQPPKLVLIVRIEHNPTRAILIDQIEFAGVAETERAQRLLLDHR